MDESADPIRPLESWWATEITRLTWADDDLAGATSHRYCSRFPILLYAQSI
jgi:hypothetical protein